MCHKIAENYGIPRELQSAEISGHIGRIKAFYLNARVTIPKIMILGIVVFLSCFFTPVSLADC